MGLDFKDKKILYQLDLNARQTDSEIAKKTNLSREVVTYRIKRLIKKEYIRNFTTILNYNALNLLSYRIYFKLGNISKESEKEFVDFLKDRVAWLVRVRGNWSFNTVVFLDDLVKLEEFIIEIKEKFNENLMKLHFSQIIRIYHYRRAYFKDSINDATNYDLVGEINNKVTLDDIDLKILNCIQNKGRMSSIEIALKIEISERIVRYRIKNLINKRVILNFRPTLNIDKLNLSYFKLHIKLNIFQKNILKEINEYMHNNPNVIYKTNTIGGWDLELELQVKSSKELYLFIDKLINDFPGAIGDYEFLEYDKEYKLSYLNKL